jgi:hypothetical protein
MISQGAVLDIARDAIYTILITSAPLLQLPGQPGISVRQNQGAFLPDGC